jgi:hypothetical protein
VAGPTAPKPHVFSAGDRGGWIRDWGRDLRRSVGRPSCGGSRGTRHGCQPSARASARQRMAAESSPQAGLRLPLRLEESPPVTSASASESSRSAASRASAAHSRGELSLLLSRNWGADTPICRGYMMGWDSAQSLWERRSHVQMRIQPRFQRNFSNRRTFWPLRFLDPKTLSRTRRRDPAPLYGLRAIYDPAGT